ncbi:Retrovirus-related Pol polyprotein from type-1 retrotransposable element R2 [Chionoecetes opilio]|uniref:Retrovirus-related Pol polyprotein from type-1 retrotransposable element R2 n=1 Tax=Chionoecetes opilio TaxID=41210 RepID=A0A8J8WMH5_CHIOP|nr:Retrovirus-related Pol polyprotein from type-1 retrotransposable element R2 [Chionoecetes opilio]
MAILTIFIFIPGIHIPIAAAITAARLSPLPSVNRVYLHLSGVNNHHVEAALELARALRPMGKPYHSHHISPYKKLEKQFGDGFKLKAWRTMYRGMVEHCCAELRYNGTAGGTAERSLAKTRSDVDFVGVRQGCVLAPSLFNACMDWVLDKVVDQSDCGASVGNTKITDLVFADDAVIFAESLEVLVMALEALHEEAKPLGLEVSWLKTKVQVFGDLLDEAVHADEHVWGIC